MSNEIEAIGAVSGLFIGIGGLIVMLVFAYFFYQIGKMFQSIREKEDKYELLEEMALDKMAKGKGIDLRKEELKRNVFRVQKKSFRRRVEEEVYAELFPKDKKDEE